MPRRAAASCVLILGLDPGSRMTGYGLVERRGSTLRAIDAGRIVLPAHSPLDARLALLVGQLDALLQRCAPDAIALERVFHGPNTKSLIILAHARGAILAQLGLRGLPVVELTPAEVKTAIAGNGRADKRQVSRMVEVLLGLPRQRRPSDVTDALALAICGIQRSRMGLAPGRLN